MFALPAVVEENDSDFDDDDVPAAAAAASARVPPRRPPGAPPAAARVRGPVGAGAGGAPPAASSKHRATTSFVTDPGMTSYRGGPPETKAAGGYDTSAMVSASRATDRTRLGHSSGRVAAKPKPSPSKKQLEDQKLQQLRGIFAAFDENRDGILTKEELANALLSLGINPTPKVIQKYQIGSTTGVIDLPTFMNVSMTRLQGVETTADQIEVAFREFDTEGTGVVSSQVVRHLLHELSVETALTAEEAEDLLRMTGVVSKDGPYMGLGVAVNYRDLINKMMFVQ